MQLVIVESPTKAKTIEKFLKTGYKVLSSYGHVRDLPKGEFGIDVENKFNPKYVIMLKARKNVNLLKKEVEKADSVVLATDEDREGEAIAYHLAFALGLGDQKKYKRIAFHEITKTAIEEALKKPREIDTDLVNAQQARRILDRIVGYKLSPFLWKKVARRLSAGRVQSVAVRLVAEREKEIQDFIKQEYWTVTAHLKKHDKKKEWLNIEAMLIKQDGKAIPKLGIKTEQEAKKIIDNLERADFKIANITKKEVHKNPLPPFTTSTLQQSSWQKFRMPAKFTMSIAQRLYETGLITYHRTDSMNLSEQSLREAQNFITKQYGEKYWPGSSRRFKTKSKGAQEAHEAIRPTYPDKHPDTLKLDKAQAKIYSLIWQRFISCQMSPAIFDSIAVDIEANQSIFRSTGQTLKFDGFLRVYQLKFEEKEMPPLQNEELLELIKLLSSQHFTQPPPRYTEASLIKALEEYGIGRPSTYAPILSTIQERNYIEKDDQKRFIPTEIGTVVNNLLVEHFPNIVDMQFTAEMEQKLDEIAEGKEDYVKILKDFYDPFAENLQKKYEEVAKKDIAETPTDKKCPNCESPLIIRLGKFGKFYACSAFPKCKYTQSLKENTLNIKCPKCNIGEVVIKRTKKGKIFYGCSKFPDCDFAAWDKPTGKLCPKCSTPLVETKKKQVKCPNKECQFIKED